MMPGATIRWSVVDADLAARTPPPANPAPRLDRRDPDRPRTPFVLLPDGRARRVLDHLRGGVFQVNAILSATNPGTYSRKVERTRIHRILWVMSHAGLVRLVKGEGWTATAAGVAAVEALEAATHHPDNGAVQ